MKAYIYSITNKINNKIYIGQTLCIDRRFTQHRKNKKYYIGHAIQKYGEENFKFEIIYESGEFEPTEYNLNIAHPLLDNLERKFIRFFNSNNKEFGYNLTSGAEKLGGGAMSEETKLKISEKNKGKKRSVESRKLYSKLRSIYRLGKGCVPVVQYDLDGNFIEEFNSIQEAVELTKVNQTSLISCCMGRAKILKAGGFQWKYKSDVTDINNNIGNIKDKYMSRGRKILQYDLNNVFIREWKSMKEIYEILGYDRGSIISACKGKTRHKHYIWKYKEESTNLTKSKRKQPDKFNKKQVPKILTDENVIHIRKLYAEGMSHIEIWENYYSNVSVNHIKKIVEYKRRINIK